MNTETTTNRKPPTKAEAMKVLIEMERKLMIKENEEAEAAKEEACAKLKQAVVQYVLENLDALKVNFVADTGYQMVEACIKFTEKPSDDNEEPSVLMPPHVKKLYKVWDDIDSSPNGWNVERLPERNIRERINNKLKRVNASAVINGNNCSQVERTPVVKEYLEEFLASLTKASKAAERLVA